MSKMKKLFAMLLTLVMIMGIGTTTMAATVTVNNVVNGKYVQVIKADPTNVTGWAFVDDLEGTDQDGPIVAAYREAFNTENADDIIRTLIQYQKNIEQGNQTLLCTSQIAAALSNVQNATGISWTNIANGSFNASEAGVYAVVGEETGYTYNTMSAYVGFGEVTDENYPTLQDTTVNAKKAPITITKEDDDLNNILAVGDMVTYTLKTKVPYMDPTLVDDPDTEVVERFFHITDRIDGAYYYFGEDVDDINGKNKVATVTIGGDQVDATFVKSEDKKSFVIDLTNYVDKTNSRAGQDIVVTYTAILEGETVDNYADAGHSGLPSYGEQHIKLYSGTITLVKYAEDNTPDNLQDNKKLANAKFVMYNKDNKFATFNSSGLFDGWVEKQDNATVLTTGVNGEFVVKGLDIGTYYFKEIEAPEGYSLNSTDVSATLTLGEAKVATDIIYADTHMLDTQLSALPSTGGIGTTVFTIGGCAIMIAAAFFFFVSRRKDA